MIFSIKGHIDKIINGKKTQTRRRSDGKIYRIGKCYTIQEGRNQKGRPEGKILIIDRKIELRQDRINSKDALAEGDYSPKEFEKLFEELYPEWDSRYAYTFIFFSQWKL